MKLIILFFLLVGVNIAFSQADTIKFISTTDSIQKAVELKQVKADSIKLIHSQQLSIKFTVADSLFKAKKFKEAHAEYLGADKFNAEVVQDSLIANKLKLKIDELATIFQCHQKIDSAKILFQIKKYYEVLPLLEGCDQYDTTNLLLNTKAQIKIIEDSILFEGYVKEIKAETDKKEYKKALEIISKAKLIKTNAYVDSTEAQNTRMLVFINEKNQKRFNEYKKITDDLVSFLQKSDTNSQLLLAKKQYYHTKYDTCIAYLKTTYKEVYAGVKSHQDFDKEKNEFKITDYWDEKDEEVLKLLEELKSKTDYQNRFIAKIEQVIKNDDDKALRNFRKYVYIKDIIYVFLLP